jgi:hypothetical protein
LQSGGEESEVVTYLLPGAGENHHEHGLTAVHEVVPGDTVMIEETAEKADLRVQEKEP